MSRRLSLRSYATRARDAAAELGQRVAAINLAPDGTVRVEFAPQVAPPSEAVFASPDEQDEAAARVEAAFKGRRRAAA